MGRELNAQERARARKAVDTWTGKFVQAQKQAGQKVDRDAAKKRAIARVNAATRTYERQKD